MSSSADFVIQDGKLKKYTGPGRDVVIPDGVTSIGEDAFRNCGTLTSVVIPEGVTSIGWHAFSGCSSLTSITIPEGVTGIGWCAFSGCSSLTSITIPEGVTSIGGRAFSYCSSLTSITIPESVTGIDSDGFFRALRSVTMLGEISADGEIFDGCMALENIDIRSPKTMLGKKTFGEGYPPALIPQTEALLPHLADSTVKSSLLRKEVWDGLSPELCAEIYLTRRKDAWTTIYDSLISKETADAIGRAVAARTTANSTAKLCGAAAAYVLQFQQKMTAETKKAIYAALKAAPKGAAALRKLEADEDLMRSLNGAEERELSPFEKKCAAVALKSDVSRFTLECRIKEASACCRPSCRTHCSERTAHRLRRMSSPAFFWQSCRTTAPDVCRKRQRWLKSWTRAVCSAHFSRSADSISGTIRGT